MFFVRRDVLFGCMCVDRWGVLFGGMFCMVWCFCFAGCLFFALCVFVWWYVFCSVVICVCLCCCLAVVLLGCFFVWLFLAVPKHFLYSFSALFALAFFISLKKVTHTIFFFVVLRPEHIYQYLGVRQRPVIAFPGRRP